MRAIADVMGPLSCAHINFHLLMKINSIFPLKESKKRSKRRMTDKEETQRFHLNINQAEKIAKTK